MRCNEIMNSDVECIDPMDTVEAAARKMAQEDIGFLPVCSSDRKVVGTLTDRDIALRVVAKGKRSSCLVREVMTTEVVACRPDDDVREAEKMLASYKKSRMMCTDEGGRLVGVIGLSDLARREEAAPVAHMLRHIKQPDGLGRHSH